MTVLQRKWLQLVVSEGNLKSIWPLQDSGEESRKCVISHTFVDGMQSDLSHKLCE